MSWLRETTSDSRTGTASSKRVVMIMAAAAMSVAVIILALGAWFGYEVAAALGAVCVPLAGMSGVAYVGGKRVEGEQKGAIE